MITLDSIASRTLVLGALLLVVCSPCPAGDDAVRYVDDDAPAAGDGLSWDTAYRFLQDALADAAAPGSGVTTIRIAGGTYWPDRSEAAPAGTGDRAATFALVTGVTLEGGYLGLSAGAEESPDDRQVTRHPSVLTGDLQQDDGPPGTFTNYADNTLHVVTADAEATIDGLTIRAGNANGAGDDAFGGGLLVRGVAHASNCTLLLNTALQAGGGAACLQDASADLEGCAFSGNLSLAGGGFTCQQGVVTISGSGFDGNSAVNGGGLGQAGGDLTVTDCTFEGNTAPFGGGFHTDGGTACVSSCQLTGNQGQDGGGIFDAGSDLVVQNCLFSGNTVTACGGGFNTIGSEALVINCSFAGNAAGVVGGGGVAIPLGHVTIVNCLFYENEGAEGGGMLTFEDGAATLHNCTFTENTSPGGNALGTASKLVTLTNCIVWNNPPFAISGQPSIAFSCVEGGYIGAGNISSNPQFVDPAGHDYRLSPGSPAIDAGHNWGVPQDTADIDDDGVTRELVPL
ncbi:MAG: right-handed parallel beta-helix repeat-containing protein, partial [Planctomycetota bacterium]